MKFKRRSNLSNQFRNGHKLWMKIASSTLPTSPRKETKVPHAAMTPAINNRARLHSWIFTLSPESFAYQPFSFRRSPSHALTLYNSHSLTVGQATASESLILLNCLNIFFTLKYEESCSAKLKFEDSENKANGDFFSLVSFFKRYLRLSHVKWAPFQI